MRTLGLLEITLPKVTQPEVANANPGILVPTDMHMPHSPLTLKDVTNMQNDGPVPDAYRKNRMDPRIPFTKHKNTQGDCLLFIRFWELGSVASLFLLGGPKVGWKLGKTDDTKGERRQVPKRHSRML